jgi:hypothetical protein
MEGHCAVFEVSAYTPLANTPYVKVVVCSKGFGHGISADIAPGATYFFTVNDEVIF